MPWGLRTPPPLCSRTGLSSAGLGVSPAQAGRGGPSSTCLCGRSQSQCAWDLPSSLPLEVLTLAPSPILLGFLCLSLSAALESGHRGPPRSLDWGDLGFLSSAGLKIWGWNLPRNCPVCFAFLSPCSPRARALWQGWGGEVDPGVWPQTSRVSTPGSSWLEAGSHQPRWTVKSW